MANFAAPMANFAAAVRNHVIAHARAQTWMLSLVVYRFTSKLDLFVAIFESRQYVNQDRLAAIPGLSNSRRFVRPSGRARRNAARVPVQPRVDRLADLPSTNGVRSSTWVGGHHLRLPSTEPS
jgi:hypothetical protein